MVKKNKKFKKRHPGKFIIVKNRYGEYAIKRNGRTVEVETSLDKARGAKKFYKKYFSYLPKDRKEVIRAGLI